MYAFLLIACIFKFALGGLLVVLAASGVVVEVGTRPAPVPPEFVWVGVGHMVLALVWYFASSEVNANDVGAEQCTPVLGY